MLSNGQIRQGRSGLKRKVSRQARQTQGAGRERLLEILGDGRLLISGGGQVEGFNHELSGIIGRELSFELLPQFAVVRIRQEVGLPGAIEKGAGLTMQGFNHMAIINTPPPALLGMMDPNTGEFDDPLSAEIADHPVVVQM